MLVVILKFEYAVGIFLFLILNFARICSQAYLKDKEIFSSKEDREPEFFELRALERETGHSMLKWHPPQKATSTQLIIKRVLYSDKTSPPAKTSWRKRAALHCRLVLSFDAALRWRWTPAVLVSLPGSRLSISPKI